MKSCRFAPVLLLFGVICPLSGQQPASYQKKAAAALQFEVDQIGKDCPDAKTTLEQNSCMAGVEQKATADFQAFYESLRSLLGPNSEAVKQLDSSQAQWEKYSKQACDAIDTFYRDGSIRISAVMGCQIQLRRSRMQDLDVLYNTTLHL